MKYFEVFNRKLLTNFNMEICEKIILNKVEDLDKL